MAGRRGVKIYKDKRWKVARRIVLERADYRCEVCHMLDSYLEVHHIEHIANRDNINEPVPEDFNVNRLQAICRPCHFKAHRHRRIKSEREKEWDKFVEELL